jgi:hypothetical protein
VPPGVALAAALLSPAAPLPYTVREGVPGPFVVRQGGGWTVWLFREGWEGHEPDAVPLRLYAGGECYDVHAGLVLTVDGRRADLGELPGLLDRRWRTEGGWHKAPRAKSCRAWVRGGRLEALEVSLR